DWTVGRRGIPYYDWGVHPGRDWIRMVSYGGPYSPKKNTYYKADIGTLAGTVGWGFANNALNFTPMRFADVLLMAAEAANELGGAENVADAVKWVNMVRARARGTSTTVLPDVAFTTKEALREIIKKERRAELAMEGDRFFDLVRWGDAAAVLGSLGYQNKHRYFPIPQAAIDFGGGILVQNPEW
ncbi:MAG: RagB/SusD family nutrient uptake outer membrane protein, partial [Flavitalea sp.]